MANYIPRKDYTDPVDYAAIYARRFDSSILKEVAQFRVNEEVLMNLLKRRKKWDYKRYY